MANAGGFKIEVWTGGHPIWCTIQYDGKEIRINALELADLAFAVERARMEARHEARRMDPQRVGDY